MSNTHLSSEQIRSKLNHPVIDGDGHCIEFLPFFHEYLAKVAGRSLAEAFKKTGIGEENLHANRWQSQTPDERKYYRQQKYAFHSFPSGNTYDRATAMLPKLLYKRLDEFGIDFSIVYPTVALLLFNVENDEFRRSSFRALNMMNADLYREFRDRLAPVAAIPTTTPEEAVEELEYCVKTLGSKTIMISGNVRRHVPAVADRAPDLGAHALWCDHMAIDSKYDYDPFWAKCVELRVAPTAHSGQLNIGSRKSVSSYVYNHIGSFAEANHAFCKAVLLGGVTHRFPTLRMGFLEGGVAWAGSLLEDTIGHWKKRNREAIKSLDPASIDIDRLEKAFREYGGKLLDVPGNLRQHLEKYKVDFHPPGDVDEFAASGVGSEEDIRRQFKNYFFGCEADDPSNALAFRGERSAHLHAMFSSDISHWDVPDMAKTVEEAYELVEDGHIDERAFRDFMFVNPARLHAGMNPDFFKGTRVEKAVADIAKAEIR